MRLIINSILALLSLNCFSQSYLIMDNGIIITTDKQGFSYDFGHYAYPHKVTLKGGQYFVEEGNILSTIDENGLLFRKYEVIPDKIKGKGINYFISDDGGLYAIDKMGFLKLTESENFKNVLNFGGNYFTASSETIEDEIDIYVVTSEGVVLKSGISGVKKKDIVSFGGNYFMNSSGVIHTVSTDGLITIEDNMRVGIIQKRGGNFFIDSAGFFYSVSITGELKLPMLPLGLNVSAIQKYGANYFIDQAGKLFLVNKDGLVFERFMKDHDFRHAKIISL